MRPASIQRVFFYLGLIVNEIVTNIFKNAFETYTDGVIEFSLLSSSDGTILTICDNGQGMPPDFKPGESEGFGLLLIKLLSGQMGAKFMFRNRKSGPGGTVFSLEIASGL